MNNRRWFKLLIGMMIALVFIMAASPSIQRSIFGTIIAKQIIINGSGGLELRSGSGALDINGKELTLDADADSSITADTDDQIDIELGGQNEYIFTPTVFDIAEGTLSRIDLDADGDTSLRSSTDDQIELEIGTADEFIFTASIFDIGNGTLGRIDLDADNDTSIRSSAEDQIDLELGGSDQVVLKAVAAADSAATNEYTEVAFTSPVDTTGANTHNAVTIDLAIGNATGGTNAVTALQIDAIVDDPQVVEKAINIGDEWDYAIDTGLPIVASAMYWFDDFIGDTVLAQYTEASGTDAEAVQTIVEEQFGVYELTSGNAGVNTAGDAEQVSLSLEWQPDQGAMVFEIRLHLDTAITTVELCVGLTDNVALELPFTNAADVITAVANDAVAFCFDTNATTQEWFALGVAGTTAATGNGATGTAPAADVYQVLRIEIDDGGADCRFYIDNTLVGTLTANCVTVTVALAPVVVISSAQTAVSHVVDVDYILVGTARD